MVLGPLVSHLTQQDSTLLLCLEKPLLLLKVHEQPSASNQGGWSQCTLLDVFGINIFADTIRIYACPAFAHFPFLAN